jgi:hypothetical protein
MARGSCCACGNSQRMTSCVAASSVLRALMSRSVSDFRVPGPEAPGPIQRFVCPVPDCKTPAVDRSKPPICVKHDKRMVPKPI